MVSHPGEIVARFGRYEAIEKLDSSERVRRWRAWDPYIERMVTVLELVGVDPAEVFENSRELPEALSEWCGDIRIGRDDIIDFDPGRELGGAFAVVLPKSSAAGSADTDTPRRRRQESPASREPETRSAALTALYAAAIFLGGVIAGAVGLGLMSTPERATVVSSADSGSLGQVGDASRQDRSNEDRSNGDRSNEDNIGELTSGAAATATATMPPATATAVKDRPTEKPAPDRSNADRPVVSFDPPTGATIVVTGRPVVSASQKGAGKVRFEWRLDGTIVGKEPSVDVSKLDIGRSGVLEGVALGEDGSSLASGSWTLEPAPVAVPQPKVVVTAAPKRAGRGDVVVFSSSGIATDLECEWIIGGQARSRVCESVTWEVPADQPAGPMVVALRVRSAGGKWRRGEVIVPVAAVAQPEAKSPTPMRKSERPVVPSVPPTLAPPRAKATRAVPPALPTPPAKVPVADTTPEQAIATYYAGYKAKLQNNPRTSDAEFAYEVKNLARQGSGWVAEVERRVSIPGQAKDTRIESLSITSGASGLIAKALP